MATALGVPPAIAWPVGLGACPTCPMLEFAAAVAVLVRLRRHENIRRLLKGEESKIGGKEASWA